MAASNYSPDLLINEANESLLQTGPVFDEFKVTQTDFQDWLRVWRMDKNDPTELIKKLPPELRERILKEFISIKLRERNEMGWDEVHNEIEGAPVCEHNEQVVKILYCPKCTNCWRTGICSLCHARGVRHCLGILYDEHYGDESFSKDFYKGWSGKRPTLVRPPTYSGGYKTRPHRY